MSTPRSASRLGALLLMLLGPLAGCGGGSGGDGGGSGGGGDAGFNVTLTMRAANGAERSSFEFGNSIAFNITITNRSGGSQVLTLPTSQIYDLAVLPRGSSTPIWRWSYNQTFAPTATNSTFASHQSITYLYIWNGVLEDGTQITPGDYDFRGTLAYEQYASDWRADDELAAPIKQIAITN